MIQDCTGSVACACNEDGACNDNLECVGGLACVKRACVGQENCECHTDGRCLSGLVCALVGNRGVCQMPVALPTTETPTASSAARSAPLSSVIWLVLLVVMLCSLVDAHNWINSPSASKTASQYAPCLPRTSDQPHVMIGKGGNIQRKIIFQISVILFF